MNEYTRAQLQYMADSLNHDAPKYPIPVYGDDEGELLGIAFPVSQTSAVLVLYPMREYQKPVICEVYYTDLVEKLCNNPRIRIVKGTQ